jgi:hypothetical protein
MLIEGPIRVSVAETADGQGWVLVLAFKPEFQALDIAAQAEEFRDYLAGLNADIAGITAEDDPNRPGMLIIQQIVEQLMPHIAAGELELSESIIIQIQQNSQLVALTDLLRQP